MAQARCGSESIPSGAVGSQFYGNQSWWRCGDFRGDGKQELLFFDEGALQALGGESVEPLWKWRLPAEDAMLLEVLPAGKTLPATIAVWAGKSVYGLSGSTGRPQWRGEMPTGAPAQFVSQPDRILIRDSNSHRLPRLLAADGCRLTWPTDDAGRYRPPRGEPIAYAPVAEPVSLRPLPWVPGGLYRDASFNFGAIPWTLFWVVVPAVLIRFAFRRNSWRLAFVPALYQLATVWSLKFIPFEWTPFDRGPWSSDPYVGICFLSALFLIVHVAWMIRRRLWAIVDASAIYAIAIAIGWSQRETNPGTEQYGYAFHFPAPIPAAILDMLAVIAAGLPTIAAMFFAASWLRRRQWGRMSLFVVASVMLSVGFAALLLQKDSYWASSDEEYSLDGWYWIVFHGIYFAGCLTILGWMGSHVFRGFRRVASKVRSYWPKRHAP